MLCSNNCTQGQKVEKKNHNATNPDRKGIVTTTKVVLEVTVQNQNIATQQENCTPF